MPTPNYKKSPLIPTNLLQRVPIEIIRNSITTGLETVSGGLPKKFLEIGDILKFEYFERTRYKNNPPLQQNQVLNPIVICCGFEMNRIHGIDLRILNMKDEGGNTETVLYRNYKQKYYVNNQRNDVPLIDITNFNPKAINSGWYGKGLHRFYRSYNLDKIGGRHVIIINIQQAEIESGMGHRIVPLPDYER